MKKSSAQLLFLFLFMPGSFFIVSCGGDSKQDDAPAPTTIDKHGSIEVKIRQHQTDSFTIIQTDKYVYNDLGEISVVKTNFDTIPLLKMESDTLDTGRTYQDVNGDEQEKDTVITHRKNYQLYINLK